MMNLAHPKHATSSYESTPIRLHRRLAEVMNELGTLPDEIRWPTESDIYEVQAVAS